MDISEKKKIAKSKIHFSQERKGCYRNANERCVCVCLGERDGTQKIGQVKEKISVRFRMLCIAAFSVFLLCKILLSVRGKRQRAQIGHKFINFSVK